MKFILVADNTDSEETQKLWEEANNLFENAILMTTLSSLLFVLERNHPPKIFYNSEDISDANIVYCRSTKHNRVAKSVLMHTFEKLGANIVDSASRFPIGFASKLLSSIERHSKNCIVDTYISFSYDATHKLISLLPNNQRLFIKPINGSQNRGTCEILAGNLLDGSYNHRYSENNPLYIQKFIDIDKEYRIFLVNGQIVGNMKKVRRGDGSIKYKRMRFARLHEFVIQNVSDKGVLGVDACQDVNGEFYIIEANRSPMFRALENRTNSNIAREILIKLKGE